MSAAGRIAEYVRNAAGRLRQGEHVLMVLVSVVIGALGGLGAVGFRELIRIVNIVAWRQPQYTLEYIQSLPAWWKILAPALGGLAVGLITFRLAREVKGHGVPEVMEAVALRGGRIRPRVVLAKLLASGICIGSGGSVGREGPIVQIGSALGSSIGQWLKVDSARLRTLVGCGAAAGIAATFNAPVAGALFAVEVILGDFGVAQFSPIVISSVTGTVVSQHFLGDFPAFQVPRYSLVHAGELMAYAVLGILAGLVALAFCKVLYKAEDVFEQIPVPAPIRPLIGGALVGVVGIWLPQVYGVGYEAINEALDGNVTLLPLLLALLAAKLVAVSLTIGSGGSGGIFAPSLFLGAMLGGAVGTLVHSIWPQLTGTPGAYALVGMGAVVASATHAPITAIVIIFELTGDYKIILPLMVSCIIATLLATQLQKGSIYTLKLLRRGVDIRGGVAINLLENIPVREIMRGRMATVAPHANLNQLVTVFVEHPGHSLFVVDEQERLLGVITSSQLRPAMGDAAALSSLVIAEDLMTPGTGPATASDASLADVMKVLGTYRGEIPVLQDGRLVGVIWPQDVIERYNTELFKRDMARSLVSATQHTRVAITPAVEDAVVAEIPVPAAFVGRSIGDLNIRHDYGFSVLIIKRRAGGERDTLTVVPSADYVFRPGDAMLVLGPGGDLPALQHGVPGARPLRKPAAG